jgi:predicted ferric reductase
MIAEGSQVVVVAGGIGITPYLSILSSIPPVSGPGKVTLIWATRDGAFADYLKGRLGGIARKNVEVHVHVTDGEGGEGTIEEEEVSAGGGRGGGGS